jgi:hypothetical protein
VTSFTKLDAKGKPLSVRSTKWVAVYDKSTDLTWSRAVLPAGRLNWKAAQAAVKQYDLLGQSDWRVPTRVELLTLVDDTRHGPAIDTRFFPECESTWHWTSTPAAYSPGDYACVVGFSNGGSNWNDQGYECFVRAVRAGQSLSFGSSKGKRKAVRS